MTEITPDQSGVPLEDREKLKIAEFDRQAGEYDRWFDNQGRLIFEIELKSLQSISADLPRPWVEIGIGSGRFAHALGIDSGVDPSAGMAALAVRRGIQAVTGRGEQTGYPSDSVGTVFLITTLCFLQNPKEVVKEAHRILRPGGRLVIAFIQKESPWGQLYQAQLSDSQSIYRFARFYSAREVVLLTMQAGFEGERMLSTLFQNPGQVSQIEEPRPGLFLQAGLVVLVVHKNLAQ